MLHRERLDDVFWLGHTEAWLNVPGVGTLVESWSGYALERTGVVSPFVLTGLATKGETNLATAGALRFWFRPYWSAAPAGGGPGQRVCLAEMLAAETSRSITLWRLEVEADGSSLMLVRQSDGGEEVLLRTALDWKAGEWHQLALNYSPKATVLFVDGLRVGTGAGVPTAPPAALRLVWGSNPDGKQAAEGELDELYTFAGPLEVGLQYTTLRELAALGPISEEEDRQLAEAEAKWASAESRQAEEPLMQRLGGTPECFTNVPVYLTNLAAVLQANSGWTARFDLQGGPSGVHWDIFGTTNLAANHVTNAQWFWLERGLSCSTYQYTNQFGERSFYIVGSTNDTDGGGLPDAYERLVTHTDPGDPGDDRLLPLVSIYATDSVAVENQPTNTARFLVTRLGGLMQQPLTVGCLISGTASNGVDYWLYGVTATPTNVLVTFAPGETAREITVAPVNDALVEGSETVTLTLTTNVQPCEVNMTRASATAWILESYAKVFTTVADFNLGVMNGLEAVGSSPTNVDGRLQFKTNLPPQFPFIAVACSGRGTVARINTTNGQVVGEYRTTPAGLQYSGDSGPGPQPSRTTVDLFGNVWVANRADRLTVNGTNYGSITRVGLIIGGSRFDKIGTNYVPNPRGQYVALSNATYNTCMDRDGDGFIRTSRGLADILAWNNGDGVDSAGGVSTAEDEAITEYTRVPREGTRSIAVDRFNDIWVGRRNDYQTHVKVNGLTGLPVPNSAFDARAGGYGAVIDSLGNLWSAGWGPPGNSDLLRLVPPDPTNYPPRAGVDWTNLTTRYGVASGYGIAVDPLHRYIWQTAGSDVFRWHTNGAPVTDAQGAVIRHWHGAAGSQGLVVDTNGHVWVAHGGGSTTVGHLNTNGTHLGNVPMQLAGLRGEYFADTNFSGTPALVRTDGPLNFDWGHGSPGSGVPSNYFCARWLGVLEPRREGEHVLVLSADVGAAVRLTLAGQEVSSNWWTEPGPYPVELYLTNHLSTNTAYSLKVEYIEFTGEARVQLSWREPGAATNAVIPLERFQQLGQGPTGVSVDAAGKVWAANLDSHNAMRIDPNAGPMVVTTNAGGG